MPQPMRNDLSAPQFGTTPFPNVLLDRVMPRLGDTEWRVLSVIVRQTFGWTAGPGLRKTADWLSHSQLRRRTGRESAAISRAIDVLVRSGLILVMNGRGAPLMSAAERRRSRDHLSFRLHPAVLSGSLGQLTVGRLRISLLEKNKRKIYKKEQQQHLTGLSRHHQRI